MIKVTKNPLFGASAPADTGSGPAPAPAASTGAEPGEVRQFAVGRVPAGWGPISGPAALSNQPTHGTIVPSGFSARTNQGSAALAQWPVATTKGRLFVSLRPSRLIEVDANYAPLREPVNIPYLDSNYNALLIPLDDGNLLRLGVDNGSYQSGITQRYNVDERTFTTLASKPGADASAIYSKACQAGDGAVYGVFTTSAARVDKFNPGTNTWTENVAAAPGAAQEAVGIVRLPSGKLFVAMNTAQYVFDPATKAFTQVNTVVTGVKAAVLATAAGARLYKFDYAFGDSATGLAFYDFNEATGAMVLTDAKLNTPLNTHSTCPLLAVRDPYSGAVILKGMYNLKPQDDYTYLHYQPYQPTGVVTAVKD